MAVGALVGGLYFFVLSGWRRDHSPFFKARRAAAWWGLFTAELMLLVLKAPGQGQNQLADIVFGLSGWIIFGITTSLIFGLAFYIFKRSFGKSA